MLRNTSIVFFLLAVLFIDLSVSQKKLVCYHTNWSQYRPDNGKFFPENIDANLCTHIIYSFAKISGDRLIAYEWNDEDTDWSRGMYSRMMALRAQNPSLKILIAVGGWNHGGGPFSMMVHDTTTRSNFVRNSVDFLKKNGFDGLDLDWEYPGDSAGRPTDKTLFTTLVKELKSAFQPNGLLLTAAVAAGQKSIDNGYEIAKIAQDLDWINLMSYDLHGAWETFTGHNAGLYSRSNEYGEQSKLNVDWAVNYWLTNGTPKEKLVLGLGTYGRSFRITNGNNPGDSAAGGASAGVYTRESGFLAYYEICQKISQGWTKKWDNEAKVPYAYSGNEWVGYDDVQSLKEKVDYLKIKGLGGAMFWALDLDDFNGQFCGQGKYPLINSVKSELNFGVVTASTTKGTVLSTIGTTISSGINTNSQTTIASTLAPDIKKCIGGDGVFADPSTGCKNYYICAFTNTNYPIVQEYPCADGYLFDDSVKSCNFASQVKCNGATVSTTPVTTKTTTTTASTTSTTTKSVNLSKCLNGDGIYADPATGCKSYYICAFTNTFMPIIQFQTCPDGYLFDNGLQSCNFASDVHCAGSATTTTTTSTTSSPQTTLDLSKCINGDGYYQDIATGCKSYFICAFTNTIRPIVQYYTCSNGLLFDNTLLACNTASAVSCLGATGITSTISTTTIDPILSQVCIKGDGYYPLSSSNCNEYVVCKSPSYQKYACPAGLRFDSNMKACLDNVVCAGSTTLTSTPKISTTTQATTILTSSPTTTQAATIPITTKTNSQNDAACSHGDGNYVDPTSQCKKYIECLYTGTSFAKITLYDCPTGTLFDTSLNMCLWESQVNC